MTALPFSKFPSYGKEDPFYAYACGRIRALENTLVDRVRIQRIKDLKTAGEVFRNLQDTYYGKFLQHIERTEEFSRVISEVRVETLDIVRELLEPDYLQELLKEYDFRNLKMALKLVVAEKDRNRVHPYDTVNFPFALVYEALRNDRISLLPEELSMASEYAIEAYYEHHEIRKIDSVLDRYFYGNVVQEFNSEFLKNFYRIKADFINIFTYLRLKLLEKTDYIKDYILDGGFIGSDFFLSVQQEQDFFKELESTPYFSYLREGLAEFNKSQEVLMLERGYENYLIDYLKTTRFVDMGHEPVIAYYLARMHEIKILKIIITAKLAGVTHEEITKRLSEVMA